MDILDPVMVPLPVTTTLRTITIRLTREGEQTLTPKIARLLDRNDMSLAAVFAPGDGYSVAQVFPATAIDGEWVLLAMDEAPPHQVRAAYLTLTESGTHTFDIAKYFEPHTLDGLGLLSGSFPLSMITQEGNLPSQAEIRILYRPNTGDPGDGILVGTTTCNADGTWQVSGLDENLKFDIVARIPGFNDVLISNVQPTGAPLSAHFANLKEAYEYEEEVRIQVVALGGRPPYTFEAITLPEGLSLTSDGYITGTMLGKLQTLFEVKITDTDQTIYNLIGNSYTNGDPYWDNVIALLYFNGDMEDETGALWEPASTDQNPPSFYSNGGPFDGPYARFQRRGFKSSAPLNVAEGEPITVEGWVRVLSSAPGSGTQAIVSLYKTDSHRFAYYHAMNGTEFRTFLIPAVPDTVENRVLTMTPLPANSWVFVAYVRDLNGHRVYFDGVMVDGSDQPLIDLLDSFIYLGCRNHSPYERLLGDIANIRITVGVARYTENFSPPTKPFLNF